MRKTLMIVGMGDLAGLVLNLLAQGPSFGRIVLASRNVDELQRRKNLALLVAAQLGYYPTIECVPLDLDHLDQTAELLARWRPDVVFNTATLQSWRIITQLPPAIFKELDEAQFGPWLPMHLTMVHKLMRAVRESGLSPLVVNAAFPDAVGPVLAGVGLAPTTGIGNVANVVPGLRGAYGLLSGRPIEEVEVSLFTQHYLSHRVPAYGDSGGAPYHLQVTVAGEDVSDRFDPEAAFELIRSRFQRTGGAFRQLITAASAVSVLLPLLKGESARVHAPAPNGLPGGYAVDVSPEGVSVALPEGLSLERAIALNNACQQLDGIERIDPDGTVTFTEREMSLMKAMLGYECRRMPLAEAEDRAIELGRKYREFAQAPGLPV
ncbi:MAG TPA: hypothetical protein V6D05_07330 [Stenomitos sp.]